MPRCCIFVILVLLAPFWEARPETPVRINIAEGITDPFWDPEISTFGEWTVEEGRARGLRVTQNWAAVDFTWAGPPESGRALCMTRTCNLSCAGYDTVVVRLAAPAGTTVRIAAETDAGPREHTEDAPIDGPYEYALPLDGAETMRALEIELFAAGDGTVAGWIEWAGMQNSAALDLYMQRWDYSGLDWSRHIQDADADAELSYEPRYGIFLDKDGLEALRKEHEASVAETGASRYTRLAEAAPSMNFETAIREFSNRGGKDSGRTRDVEMPHMPGGPELAAAGLVLRDRGLLEAAARYALSQAACEHWDRNFRAHFPGGPADDRAFQRSYTCEDIAEILDLAGGIFTVGGRHYLMRRLAEEGIGPIDYVTWRHEYVHETNQLAYFNKGRVFACLVLEREFPRVRPYTELALEDTVDNLNRAILPDGGYAEGPTYFGALARRNYEILWTYARARGVDVAAIVPEALRSTSAFAEAYASTTEADAIPVGDSGDRLGYDTLEAMVELMPDSYWLTMLDKRRALDGLPPAPGVAPEPRPFLALPDMGTVASYRLLDGVPLKILVPGNPAGADHAHEDKGSFVLEFGGEAFALDLGIDDYDDPIHHLYKHCQRHNMLAPRGLEERPAPPIKLLRNVKAEGRGDANVFHARMDASPGWRPYYRSWIREWHSDEPARLAIVDTYELRRGDGVAFYWQTRLPCRVEGQRVIIQGSRGTVTLDAPAGCEVILETLPLAGGESQNRIAITKRGQKGTLKIDVSIQACAP